MARKPKRPSRQRPEVDPREQRWKHNALDGREHDNKDGTDGKPIWRVSYHDGSLFALVEAAMPEEAVEIAKAHRLRKFGRRRMLSSNPPKAVLDDTYKVSEATERDIVWCHKWGVGVLTDMPFDGDKGVASSRKGLRAIRPPSKDVERPAPPESRAA